MPYTGPSSPVVLPNVGVRIPSWTGITSDIWQGLLEVSTITGGWHFVTDGARGLGELPQIHLDHKWVGDGMITFRMTEAEAATWKASGTHIVNLSTEGPSPGITRVVPDNHQAGRLAASHLVGAGLPNLAYLGRETSLHANSAWASGSKRRYSIERWEGFRDEAEERNLVPRCHHLHGHDLSKKKAWKSVEREVVEFLSSLPLPCGVFVADDQLAIVVMHAAQSMGLPIPQSISILGFGNDPEFCHTGLPPLSSVAYPAKAIGLHAARTIERQFAGKEIPEIIRVPVTTVVERGSSAFLPTHDPIVGKLLQYIRKHAPRRPVQVAELPDMTPWGITTLKKKISAVLGHGPKEEIKRVRLSRLKNLLATTDVPLIDISSSMGFGSPQDMSRFFARETDLTPTDYRIQSRSRPKSSE